MRLCACVFFCVVHIFLFFSKVLSLYLKNDRLYGLCVRGPQLVVIDVFQNEEVKKKKIKAKKRRQKKEY
jgi:hypothetical protein